MIRLIEEHRGSLVQLCQRYRVQRLEVFGVAASEDASEPQTSDLDFLVQFQPLRLGEYADAYFGLLEKLEGLFQRRVDLVMTRAIKNRYFLGKMNQSRTVLYAA